MNKNDLSDVMASHIGAATTLIKTTLDYEETNVKNDEYIINVIINEEARVLLEYALASLEGAFSALSEF